MSSMNSGEYAKRYRPQRACRLSGKMVAPSASHSRTADSTNVSSTACRSKVERLMTFEHVGGGGLLLQRFTQLVEQPRVLDGDHGLGGKVLYQRDLLVAKRANLLAVDYDDCRPVLSSLSIGTTKGFVRRQVSTMADNAAASLSCVGQSSWV